jgi:hypothetical protein
MTDNRRTSQDGALAIAAMETRLRDVERAAVGAGGFRRFPTTTARDLALPNPPVGTTVRVGTSTGTGTAMPRDWLWNGVIWRAVGWWGSSGRIGVHLSDASQACASGSTVDITWGSELHDPDGWTSGGSATLTVPVGFAGVYGVSFTVIWSTSGVGAAPAIVGYVDGTVRYGAGGLAPFGVHTLTYDVILAEAQTIKFAVFQNSGVSVNATSILTVWQRGR